MLLHDHPAVPVAGSDRDLNLMDELFPSDPPIDEISRDGASSDQYRTIKVLIQEQQAFLQTVLKRQEAFEASKTELLKKIKDLEEIVASRYPTPVSSSESSPTGSKRKRVVSREISNMVSKTHKNLQEQFRVNESSTSLRNAKVMEAIMNELTKNPNCKFSEDIIKMAVRHCYENARRNFKEQQNGMENYVEEQSKRRRYRARRQSIYDRRSSVVKQTEMDRWNLLSYQYMTEESDADDEPNVIVIHKLT